MSVHANLAHNLGCLLAERDAMYAIALHRNWLKLWRRRDEVTRSVEGHV